MCGVKNYPNKFECDLTFLRIDVAAGLRLLLFKESGFDVEKVNSIRNFPFITTYENFDGRP